MNPAIIENLLRECRDLVAACPELADDEQLCADMLEGETDIGRVLNALVKAERERKAGREGRAEYIKALQAKNAADDLAVEKMRGTMQRILEAAGLPGFKCPAGSLGLSRRKGALKFAEDFDAAKLPEAYRETVTTYKPIKDLITAALESGEAIEGAYIGNATLVLTVR